MAPRPASSSILIRQGRVLVVRRLNPPARDLFAFPGGRGEPGESAADTAIREMREETGLDVHDPREFARYELGSPESPDSHFALTVFLVSDADATAEAEAADDAAALVWVTPEELAALPAPNSVKDCLARLVEQGWFR